MHFCRPSPLQLLTLLIAAACAPAALALPPTPVGSTFSYQGQLKDGGLPATGLYDLQICLFDSSDGAIPLACAPDFDDVPVEDGLFSVELDFGTAAFAGEQRFLELRVRPGVEVGGHTILAPRQPVRPTPEALNASSAISAIAAQTAQTAQTALAAPWSGLTGVPAGFADGTDNDSGGSVTSITAGTGLDGGTITSSGSIGIADGGVGLSQLAVNAVDGARIVDGSISGSDVAADSLGAAQIGSNAVGSDELADAAVDSAALQDGAVQSGKIATAAVGTTQIDSSQVQRRVSGSCPMGEYLRGIAEDGNVMCEPVPGVPSLAFAADLPSGYRPDIAIGSDGLPVIIHGLGNDALGVTHCGNGACSSGNNTVTIASGTDVGRVHSIAVGADGLPTIAFFDSAANQVKAAKCATVDCSSGTTFNTVAAATAGFFPSISIAIGTDDNPILSFHDGTNINVAHCGDPACAVSGSIDTTMLDSGGTTADLAIGGDGLAVVSFKSNADTLKVAHCGNVSCNSGNLVTEVDAGLAVGGFNSIAIGSDGFAIIGHRSDSVHSLRVTHCSTIDCSGTSLSTDLDTDEGGAIFAAIAVPADGLPVIAYDGPYDGLVKMARCQHRECDATASRVPVEAPAAGFASFHAIAIGADGLPLIAYSTGNRLRVLKCGSRSCQ